MPSFKLAHSHHSFKLLSENSSGKNWEDFYEKLLRITYLSCSCLIVYSLLTLNGLVAQDPVLRKTNLLARHLAPVALAASQTLSDAVYLGGQMGNPLPDTIRLYSDFLSRVFASTGELLARMPKILTWSPPVPKTMLAQSYW